MQRTVAQHHDADILARETAESLDEEVRPFFCGEPSDEDEVTDIVAHTELAAEAEAFVFVPRPQGEGAAVGDAGK